MADDGPAPKRQRVSSSQPIAESWEDLLEDRGSRGHSNSRHGGHGGGGFRGQGGGGGAHGASPDMFVGDYGNSGLVAMVGVTVPETMRDDRRDEDSWGGRHDRGHRGDGGGRGGGGRGRKGRGGMPMRGGKPIWMYHKEKSQQKKLEQERQDRERIVLTPRHRATLEALDERMAVSSRPSPRGGAFSARNRGRSQRKGRRRKLLSVEAAEAKSGELQEAAAAAAESPLFQRMISARERLPSYGMRDEIVGAIEDNQVVVMSGATGCGKTTQIPQFVLDAEIAAGRGAAANIICTQPRRISAIAVAERVAAERGERVGQSVGYHIRLEKRLPRDYGSITFCTTGILLRKLQMDPAALDGVTHVMVDEVHERNVDTDFLLIILRDLLPNHSFKLVLMSATLNAAEFSTYFGDCPMMEIPGFTFAVERLFLEDVLAATGYAPDPRKQRGRSGGRNGRRHRGRKRGRGRGGRRRSNGDESDDDGDREVTLSDLERAAPDVPRRILSDALTVGEDDLDFDLIEATLAHIDATYPPDGAVLVFLPGWDDISKLLQQLTSSRALPPSRVRLLPLHSRIPSREQKAVFDRPPSGVRKIVLATNIAETSITVDDVVFVVDTGKAKIKTYDAVNNIQCLLPAFVSRASLTQRAGRAGRVREGMAFHLLTRFRYGTLDEYDEPEILRVPLESLCLQIKVLNLGRIYGFLDKAMNPPSSQSIENALDLLHELNALTLTEELTPLGTHLAALPVDPRVGVVCLYGAIFRCLDPMLTIAAALGFRDPFVSPIDKQNEADRAKRALGDGTWSDHLTLLRAYDGWLEARAGGGGRERDYAWRNFLSTNTLAMIREMKKQLCDLLRDAGFVPRHLRLDALKHDPDYNGEAANTNLVRAILCAGLYPHVIKATRAGKRMRFSKRAVRSDAGSEAAGPNGDDDGGAGRHLTEKVELHPSSILAREQFLPARWLVYHEVVKTSKVFARSLSTITPFPLLFFGGKITRGVDGGEDLIVIDRWIKFYCESSVVEAVQLLRDLLDTYLTEKMSHPELHGHTRRRRGGRVEGRGENGGDNYDNDNNNDDDDDDAAETERESESSHDTDVISTIIDLLSWEYDEDELVHAVETQAARASRGRRGGRGGRGRGGRGRGGRGGGGRGRHNHSHGGGGNRNYRGNGSERERDRGHRDEGRSERGGSWRRGGGDSDGNDHNHGGRRGRGGGRGGRGRGRGREGRKSKNRHRR